MKSKVDVTILIVFFCMLFICSCNCQTRLEGVWAGCEIRKPLIDWTLTITGDQFHLTREDALIWYKGRFRLNNNCVLKKVDLHINDAYATDESGKTILGIYEMNGNFLVVVVGEPGKPARPLSFDDSGIAVVFNFDRS